MSEETEITAEVPAEDETIVEETPPAEPEPAAGKQDKGRKPEPVIAEAASLREQLGGDEAIQNAVDILTDKLMSDPRINYFLFGVSRADQGAKHKSFLTVALRGDDEAGEAPDLREAFAQFFDKGLRDRHFDVILDHLRDTFRQMEVADELSEAALNASRNIREALFGR
ncbi:hypothetical protein JCM19379_17010 [Methyloparacoccus murrellii]